MAFLLLTRNRFLYASRRLLVEAKARGIELRAQDPRSLPIHIETNAVSLPGRGEIDGAILRYGTNSREESLLAAQALELAGVKVVNSSQAAQLASSKIAASMVLAKAGVPILPSWVIHQSSDLHAAADALGAFPLVAKREFGSQGEGVFLLETQQAARSLVPALLKEGPLLLQHFVKEAGGADMRFLVLDGAILGGVMRQGVAGEFRANLHQGATVTPLLEGEAAEIALVAASALGLRFAGVDLIQTESGLKVLEVNASAGFRGVEEACGISVAGALVEHFCAKS